MLEAEERTQLSPNDKIRVMVVDDHSITRDGLQVLLEQSGEFEVIGQAGDGVEAVTVAPDLSPDVIIMDVMMPKKDGVDACREVMETLPDTKVLILTASTNEDAVIEAVAAGATGYLQKFSGRDQLLATIRDVAAGELRVPATVVRRVFSGIRGNAEPADEPDLAGLSQREQEILTLFSQGLSYAQIGEVKGNSPVTIRNTIYRIERKLGVRTKQEIVVWAVRNGLLDDYTTDTQNF